MGVLDHNLDQLFLKSMIRKNICFIFFLFTISVLDVLVLVGETIFGCMLLGYSLHCWGVRRTDYSGEDAPPCALPPFIKVSSEYLQIKEKEDENNVFVNRAF